MAVPEASGLQIGGHGETSDGNSVVEADQASKMGRCPTEGGMGRKRGAVTVKAEKISKHGLNARSKCTPKVIPKICG